MQCWLLWQAPVRVTAGFVLLVIMAYPLRQAVGLFFARPAFEAPCFRALVHPIFSADKHAVSPWDSRERVRSPPPGRSAALSMASPALSKTAISTMRVKDLRLELESRGLEVTGIRPVLQARLGEAAELEREQSPPRRSRRTASATITNTTPITSSDSSSISSSDSGTSGGGGGSCGGGSDSASGSVSGEASKHNAGGVRPAAARPASSHVVSAGGGGGSGISLGRRKRGTSASGVTAASAAAAAVAAGVMPALSRGASVRAMSGSAKKDGRTTKPPPLAKLPSHMMQFDGGSRGNPGPSGAGAVLYRLGEGGRRDEVWSSSVWVGHASTNNEAEYSGLIEGLRGAKGLGVKKLSVQGDSKLVIQQMMGNYKVSSPKMRPLYKKAKLLAEAFDELNLEHIARALNGRADTLANVAMDAGESTCSSVRRGVGSGGR